MFFKWPKFYIKSFTVLTVLLFLNLGLPLRAEIITSEKPLFALVSTDWCSACKMLKPTVDKLKSDYGDRVEFVDLDPTEEKLNLSEATASDYGISEFFKEHRNAFPTVGIISPNGNVEKIIVGADKKETYEKVLNDLLGVAEIAKGDSGIQPTNKEDLNPQDVQSGRPEEPSNGTPRPSLPDFLDRPEEPANAGRPEELKFWLAGGQIPSYAYVHYLVLPDCSPSNNFLCANNTLSTKNTKGDNEPAVFKPWNTGTRDEKGLELKKKR